MKINSSNKSFGILFGIFFLILATYSYLINDDFKIYLIVTSFIFFILGFINSKVLTPLNIIWIKFGDLLGKIFAPIVMIIIYFFIIFPTKIILRLFNKDLLSLKIDKSSNSYWINRKNKFNSMNNQF